MTTPIPFKALEFVLLDADHNLSGFFSTEPELDEFLKDDALENHQKPHFRDTTGVLEGKPCRLFYTR